MCLCREHHDEADNIRENITPRGDGNFCFVATNKSNKGY